MGFGLLKLDLFHKKQKQEKKQEYEEHYQVVWYATPEDDQNNNESVEYFDTLEAAENYRISLLGSRLAVGYPRIFHLCWCEVEG